MLGIVGPRDSVELAQQLAAELGRSTDLLALSYQHVDEAVDLARSLEPMCEVVLFTGLVPFERAQRARPWRCDLDVIQHSPADLYRMIALILREGEGRFPRVSVDSLELDTIQQVFTDIGLPIPPVVIPLVDESGRFVFEDVEGTARSHLAAIEASEVDAALTCLAGTHRLLLAAGVTAWRIDHARVTVVEALQRAWLACEAKRTKGNSIAVVLVRAAVVEGTSRAKAKEARASVERAVMSQARRMGSRVAVDGDRFMLTATQAAIQDMLDRHRNGQKSLMNLVTKPPAGTATALGVGLGGTFATAVDSAEKAFQVSRNSGEPALVREAGIVESLVGDGHVGVSLQDTSDEVLALSEQTGLGPLTLRRLVAALGRADHTAVTAQQLAEFYGVMPRSARRMLGLLVAAGYAHEAGVRAAAGAGAGRPHVLYSVDLPALRQIMAGGSSGTIS